MSLKDNLAAALPLLQSAACIGSPCVPQSAGAAAARGHEQACSASTLAAATEALQNAIYIAECQACAGNNCYSDDTLTRCPPGPPSLASLRVQLAGQLRRAGRQAEAVVCLARAIECEPENGMAWAAYGGLLRELHGNGGRPELAIHALTRAAMLQPQDALTLANLAACQFEARNWPEAVRAYKAAVAIASKWADAWCNLGNAQREHALAGRRRGGKDSDLALEAAVNSYKTALSVCPAHPLAWNNLGNTWKDVAACNAPGDAHHRLALANACYATAVNLCPGFSAAHTNLGTTMREAGLPADSAVSHYVAALRSDSAFTEAWVGLAHSLRECGRLEAAMGAFCISVHQRLEARPAQEQGCRIDHSDLPILLSYLGSCLKDFGHTIPALAVYARALRVWWKWDARVEEILHLEAAQGKHVGPTPSVDVMSRVQAALSALPPSHHQPFAEAVANAHHSLSLVCDWRGRGARWEVVKALTALQVAAALKSGPLPTDYPLLDDYDSDVGAEAGAVSHPSTATPSSAHVGLIAGTVLPSVQPFHSLVYPCSGGVTMLALAKAYAARARLIARAAWVVAGGKGLDSHGEHLGINPLDFPEPVAPSCGPWPLSSPRALPGRSGARLRVGYLSSDLGDHPLAHLMSSVFHLHDRTRVEVFAYATSPSDGSKWRTRIEQGVTAAVQDQGHFVDLSGPEFANPLAAARRIAADSLHILVNLNGFTKGARNEIAALQPAPVQASYLGFCGTLGAPDWCQYAVVDATVVPPPSALHFSERLLYMPHTYFVTDHSQTARGALQCEGEVSTRAAWGLPPSPAVVLACHNQLYKVEPAILAVWTRVLIRVPHAVLWLLRFPAAGEARIRAAAIAFGLQEADAARRIIFSDVADKDTHLARCGLADLFLDTPSCNAHTTCADALWAGVPVLTLPGRKMATRVAASLVNAAAPDLVATLVVASLAEYEDRTVWLSNHPSRLLALRHRLIAWRDSAGAPSPLFDTQRWTAAWERALAMMWTDHKHGQKGVRRVQDSAPRPPLWVPDVVPDDMCTRGENEKEAAAAVSRKGDGNGRPQLLTPGRIEGRACSGPARGRSRATSASTLPPLEFCPEVDETEACRVRMRMAGCAVPQRVWYDKGAPKGGEEQQRHAFAPVHVRGSGSEYGQAMALAQLCVDSALPSLWCAGQEGPLPNPLPMPQPLAHVLLHAPAAVPAPDMSTPDLLARASGLSMLSSD